MRSEGLLLVDKYRLGNRPDETKKLRSETVEILEEGQREHGGLDPSHEKYQNVLEQVYEDGKWIGCLCREGKPFKSAPVPLVTVQKRDRYSLMRLPKRPSHADGCPFEGEGGKSDPTRRVGEPLRDVCFHRQISDRTETREATNYNDTRPTYLEPKRSTLERNLYTLLRDSGLNRTRGESLSPAEAFGKVAEAAGEHSLHKFSLRDYLWTRPWNVPEASRQIREDWEKWDSHGSAQPHGIFIFESKEVDDRTIIYEKNEDEEDKGHEVKDSLEMRAPDTRPPHIFLMTIAGSEEQPKWLEPRKAFGVPIANELDQYFPIESEVERYFANMMADVLPELNSCLPDRVEELSLKKQLFTIKTYLGDCRPDLIIEWGSERIPINLVESMDTFLGGKDSVDQTPSYQRLSQIGRPAIVETEGYVGMQIKTNLKEKVNPLLEEITNQKRIDEAPRI